MSGFYRSIEYIVAKVGNNAEDTKQSIIAAASSYEYIKTKVKEVEEKAWEEVKNEKVEQLHFDPSEIEPIVLKDREER